MDNRISPDLKTNNTPDISIQSPKVTKESDSKLSSVVCNPPTTTTVPHFHLDFNNYSQTMDVASQLYHTYQDIEYPNYPGIEYANNRVVWQNMISEFSNSDLSVKSNWNSTNDSVPSYSSLNDTTDHSRVSNIYYPSLDNTIASSKSSGNATSEKESPTTSCSSPKQQLKQVATPDTNKTSPIHPTQSSPSSSQVAPSTTSSIIKKTHIKKPLNAFMLFMKEMRGKVVAECTLKESAAINQILGRRWHSLSREEQAKYYEMARQEKELHQKLYPNWSARDNYASHSKNKKKRSNRNVGNASIMLQQAYNNHPHHQHHQNVQLSSNFVDGRTMPNNTNASSYISSANSHDYMAYSSLMFPCSRPFSIPDEDPTTNFSSPRYQPNFPYPSSFMFSQPPQPPSL